MRGLFLAFVLSGTAAMSLACGGGGGASSSSSSPELAFTQWSMEFSLGEDEFYTVDFLADGTWMSDGDANGNTWSLAGERLTMGDADGYAYDATFVDSWTIGGTVTSPEGETWPFRMTRRK